MSWSTTIALTIALAFLVYVAARGRLGNYLSVLGVTSGGGSSGSASSSTASSGGSNPLQQASGFLTQASSFGTAVSNLAHNVENLTGGATGAGSDYGGGSDAPATIAT